MMDGKEKKMFKDEGAADDWALRLAMCDIVIDDSHVNMDFFFFLACCITLCSMRLNLELDPLLMSKWHSLVLHQSCVVLY